MPMNIEEAVIAFKKHGSLKQKNETDEDERLPPRLDPWCYWWGKLLGHVWGHPRFKDGTLVHTSRVTSLEPKDCPRLAHTRTGSVYVLGRQCKPEEFS